METLTLASLLAEPAPLSWDRLLATNSETGSATDSMATDQPSPSDDALTLALPWMVRHMGVGGALEAVMAPELAPASWLDEAEQAAPDEALPDQAEFDPHLLGRSAQALPALQRLGHDTRLLRCPVSELAQLPLPAVLILRGGDACVLTGCHQPKRGPLMLRVVMPGVPPLCFELPIGAVAREYTGMVLLTQPNSSLAPQPPGQPDPTRRPGAARQGPLARLAAQLQMARSQAAASAMQRPVRWIADRLLDWAGRRDDARTAPGVKLAQQRPISP